MHRASAMDIERMERRRSSSSIDALRRELRDADRERFYLQAAVNSAADQWLSREPWRPAARRSTVVAIVASTVEVCLLLLGGIVWKRLATRPPDRRRAQSSCGHRCAEEKRQPLRLAPRFRRPQPYGTPDAIVPRPLSPGEFGRASSR
jgi:hypothetical protein